MSSFFLTMLAASMPKPLVAYAHYPLIDDLSDDLGGADAVFERASKKVYMKNNVQIPYKIGNTNLTRTANMAMVEVTEDVPVFVDNYLGLGFNGLLMEPIERNAFGNNTTISGFGGTYWQSNGQSYSSSLAPVSPDVSFTSLIRGNNNGGWADHVGWSKVPIATATEHIPPAFSYITSAFKVFIKMKNDGIQFRPTPTGPPSYYPSNLVHWNLNNTQTLEWASVKTKYNGSDKKLGKAPTNNNVRHMVDLYADDWRYVELKTFAGGSVNTNMDSYGVGFPSTNDSTVAAGGGSMLYMPCLQYFTYTSLIPAPTSAYSTRLPDIIRFPNITNLKTHGFSCELDYFIQGNISRHYTIASVLLGTFSPASRFRPGAPATKDYRDMDLQEVEDSIDIRVIQSGSYFSRDHDLYPPPVTQSVQFRVESKTGGFNTDVIQLTDPDVSTFEFFLQFRPNAVTLDVTVLQPNKENETHSFTGEVPFEQEIDPLGLGVGFSALGTMRNLVTYE